MGITFLHTGRWLSASLFFLIFVMATLAMPSAVQAGQETDATADGPSLHVIMEQMGDDMQALVASMLDEDWSSVARLALRIADHTEPPLPEKKRILAWLADRAPDFREHDLQVRSAARELAEAAANREDVEVMGAAHARTLQQCLACHARFRQAYVNHFSD